MSENSNSTSAGIERILGALESTVKTLSSGQDRLEKNLHDVHNNISREMAVQFANRKEALEAHITHDEAFEKEMRRNYLDLIQRLDELKALADTVEGHGAAIVDIESRIDEKETTEKVSAATRATNAKWLKAIFFCVMILLTGKVSEWIPQIVKLFH